MPVDAGTVLYRYPRGADRRRDRRDRAAARVPGERPRRRDASGRRSPARSRLLDPAGRACGRARLRRRGARDRGRRCARRASQSRGRRPARGASARARGARARGQGATRRRRRRGDSTATSSSPPAAGSPPTRSSRRPVRGSSTTTALRRLRADGASRTGSRRSGASRARASSAGPRPSRRTRAVGKCFVCVCEDVTTKDVKRAIGEGFDSIELSKRYTTVTMGPCQGKLCQLPSIRLYAQELRSYESAIGTTTARPPWAPVELGLLAGRHLEPTRRDVAPLPARGARRDR